MEYTDLISCALCAALLLLTLALAFTLPPRREVTTPRASDEKKLDYQVQKKSPPSLEAAVNEEKEDNHHRRTGVFHISDNVFTRAESTAACQALGARLATLEELQEAHRQGAHWCSYGWSQDGLALYPTQQSEWEKLPARLRSTCGMPGVNGGVFRDPEMRFGVNCFGALPEHTACKSEAKEDTTVAANFVDHAHQFNVAPFSPAHVCISSS